RSKRDWSSDVCSSDLKHPEDQSHRYKDSAYWIELANILEKGRFDAVFLADVLGTYDVYQGSRNAAVRQGAQSPVNDPLLVVPLRSEERRVGRECRDRG